MSPSSFAGGQWDWRDQCPGMTAPYFETSIPLGQRRFYPFTRESLAAIDARIAEKGVRRKATDDHQQVSIPQLLLTPDSHSSSRLTH